MQVRSSLMVPLLPLVPLELLWKRTKDVHGKLYAPYCEATSICYLRNLGIHFFWFALSRDCRTKKGFAAQIYFYLSLSARIFIEI